MKRTREELIADIEYYTKSAEDCTKRAEKRTKSAEHYTEEAEYCTNSVGEAQKELDELNQGDEG